MIGIKPFWQSPFIKIIALCASIFLLALCLWSVVVYMATTKLIQEQLKERVLQDIEDLTEWHHELGEDKFIKTLKEKQHSNPLTYFFEYQKDNTEKFIIPQKFQLSKSDVPYVSQGSTNCHDITVVLNIAPNEDGKPAIYCKKYLSEHHYLMVGRVNHAEDRFVTALQQLLLPSLSLGLLLTAILAGVIQSILKQGLSSNLLAAKQFSEGQFTIRGQLNGSGDSFDKLTETQNQMFSQIEQLIGIISNTSSSIAHDLRTPLMRLRLKLEKAVLIEQTTHHQESSVLLQDTLQDALIETEKTLNLFNNILRLSRIESNQYVRQLVYLDVFPIIEDAIAFMSVLAEENEQQLQLNNLCTTVIVIEANKDLLFQMFTNLLDNAIKYGDKKSVIQINYFIVEDKLIIQIINSGKVVPEKDLSKIFDRFYRVSYANQEVEGHGLGLSLVKAIIEYHKGEIIAKNSITHELHDTITHHKQANFMIEIKLNIRK